MRKRANRVKAKITTSISDFLNKLGFGLKGKLVSVFIITNVIPLVFLLGIAWTQTASLGNILNEIALVDSADALKTNAINNVERMATDLGNDIAGFLYQRDEDLLYLAALEPTEENYRLFARGKTGAVMDTGHWVLDEEQNRWELIDEYHRENDHDYMVNDDEFDVNVRDPEKFVYYDMPIYDEITFIDLDGNEVVKIVEEGSDKIHYPLSATKKNVSLKENTYIKSEDYFSRLSELKQGEIYVSDVIGAYVGTNYIGTYTPQNVADTAIKNGYNTTYSPRNQAYAGDENPIGQRFEGIVRWATPVFDENGNKTGYLTMALNHTHLQEYINHITPSDERYVQVPTTRDGNYAFIWDYKCRIICHPKHHTIVGYDPQTGEPEVPWLDESTYAAWQKSGQSWTEFSETVPVFHNQSRETVMSPALQQEGKVAYDGRYLNNAPQCTRWMELTQYGHTGTLMLKWEGIDKVASFSPIPYYTGNYAPSEENGHSMRGFGFVVIGNELGSFNQPIKLMEEKMLDAQSYNLRETSFKLILTTLALVVVVVVIAIWMASSITGRISYLIRGVSRFRSGERHFRFNSIAKDEFGTLANSFDAMADNIVSSRGHPLVITDLEHKIIYMNSQALQLSGKVSTVEQAQGKLYDEISIYPGGSIYCPITAFENSREAEIYYVDATDKYIVGTANYFTNEDGTNAGYVVETTDVTEMVLVQHELEQAAEIANRANAHKGEFLARMSHEIRTPMNAIIGITDIILKKLNAPHEAGVDAEYISENIKQIETSSNHLLGLINDILDVSKIEAGKIELSEDAVDLPALAATVVEMIQPRCDEKSINFLTSIDSFSSPCFLADSLRLRQVLINLLGNAVKFTPEEGCVEFSIKNKGTKDGKTLVLFSVHDNGIGIKDSAKEAIFQSFEQGGGDISRNYGGTGLGLPISNQIVQLMGGDISVESFPGSGSTFSFEVWLKQTDNALENIDDFTDIEGRLAGKRALIVDDVELNRTIVTAMLEDSGLEMDEADDGSTALEMFEASPEFTYDIIFMDIHMPQMGGYDAAKAIRQLPRKDAKSVYIIALTANAFKEDIEKALASGMNGHIAKPLDMETLYKAMYRYLYA